MKLGEALNPLIPTEITKPILDELYDAEYEKHYVEKMRKKVCLHGDELIVKLNIFEQVEFGPYLCIN